MNNAFGLDLRCLKEHEEQLDQKYGIHLKELVNGLFVDVVKEAKKQIPIFVQRPEQTCYMLSPPSWKKQDLQSVLEKNELLPGYCSMLMKDSDDLMPYVFKLHETMYAHYVLGKVRNIKGIFPNDCCDVSSYNLEFSLLQKSWANVTMFASSKNHAYLGFPFLLENSGKKGFVLADSTSDQFFSHGVRLPRNNIFLGRRLFLGLCCR